MLRDKIDCNLPRNLINTNRHNPLDGIVNAVGRGNFNQQAKLDVQFIISDEDPTTEGAIDDGGPTRELFQLSIDGIKQLPIWDVTKKGLALKKDEDSKLSRHTLSHICFFAKVESFSILFQLHSININLSRVCEGLSPKGYRAWNKELLK